MHYKTYLITHADKGFLGSTYNAGQIPGECVLHMVYVVLEIVKLVLLFLVGILMFRNAVQVAAISNRTNLA